MVNCTHCGVRFPAPDARCPACGAPNLERVGAPPPAAEAAPSPPAVEARSSAPARAPAATGRGPARSGISPGMKGLLLLVVASVAVGLVGGLVSLVTAEVSAPSRSAARPAPEADPLAPIRERGTLRVAADPDAPPFLSRRADGGFEGYEYALMSAIASQLGVGLAIVPAPFESLDDKLRDGEADLAIGQMAASSAWEGVDFSVSYLQYSLCVVVRSDRAYAQPSDLAGGRVGLYEDPVAQGVARQVIPGGFTAVPFNDYGYFEQLARGSLDAVIYDCPLARHEIKPFGRQLRIASEALNVASYAVGVSAAQPALRARVDAILRELGNQGLLASLQARWLDEASAADGQTAVGRQVVARPGETVEALAARAGTTAAALAEANADVLGADPTNLYAGMRLRVP